jgi:phosphoglycerol transferase MdoB-like AlkP superfamily enzyme
VVDLLEVVQSGLLDLVVSLNSFNCIEVRDLQGEDVQSRLFQDETILRFDSSFAGVEESQELSIGWFALFIFVFLFSVVFAVFVFLGLFALGQILLGSLHLNSEVPLFLLIPVDCDRNVVISEVVIHEGIRIDVVDVEGVVDR